MSRDEKPKRPHPDVLAEGETAPAQKFSAPPLGGPAGEPGAISPETAAMMVEMTPEERDAFFRTLLKNAKSEDIARVYGVSESYLAVIADEE